MTPNIGQNVGATQVWRAGRSKPSSGPFGSESTGSWLDSTSTAANIAGMFHSIISTGVRTRSPIEPQSREGAVRRELGPRDACHLLVREIGPLGKRADRVRRTP